MIFGLFSAEGVRSTVPGFFGAATAFLTTVFLAVFFATFLATFLADFFAVFLGVFFAIFPGAFLAARFGVLPAFFTPRLLFAARFLAVAFLLALAGAALRAFFALRFLEAFFLDVATANSLIVSQTKDDLDGCRAERYRVASASIPKTEKTSGF